VLSMEAAAEHKIDCCQPCHLNGCVRTTTVNQLPIPCREMLVLSMEAMAEHEEKQLHQLLGHNFCGEQVRIALGIFFMAQFLW